MDDIFAQVYPAPTPGEPLLVQGKSFTMNYVLITPARNEEVFIRKELESVTAQTLPPLRWVIVDDGSTDGTAAVVGEFASPVPLD